MAKKSKVPPTYSKESFRIPACEECGEDLVKFRGKWTCKKCMKLKAQVMIGWEPEEVSFGAIYPNRQERRKKI